MQIIYTELKDTLEYTCDINVFNISMIMRVSYNSRSKKRLISLTSLDGSILYLKPTYITYGSRIFPNFNTIIEGLSFYITLDRLTLTGENYLNWANQFRLCFVEYVPFEKGEGWYLAENSLEENSITPNFGDWIIIPDGITVENNNILYQAYKTNSISTYDSFATFSLETALIRSFLDPDLQQYAAFTTAVEQLTGVSDWVLDPANNQILYTKPTDPTSPTDPTVQYYWQQGSNYTCFSTSSCKSAVQSWSDSHKFEWTVVSCSVGNGGLMNCPLKRFDKNGVLVDQTTEQIPRVDNPAYDPSAPPKDDKKTLPLETVAQKIISNAESSSDPVLKMLSEDYINQVSNSIFETDTNKQFVNIDDIRDQLEQNKTLRN